MLPGEFGLGTVFGLAAAGYVFLKTFIITKDHLARLGGGYDVLFLSAAVGVGLGLFLPLYVVLMERVRGFVGGHIPGFERLPQAMEEIMEGTPIRLSEEALPIAVMILVMWSLASLLNMLILWIPGGYRLRTYLIRKAAIRRGDMLQVVLDDSRMVEVALKGGKSYIGLPMHPYYPVPGDEGRTLVRIVPIFSGYRSGKKQLLRFARHYGGELSDLLDESRSLNHSMLVLSLRRDSLPARQRRMKRWFSASVAGTARSASALSPIDSRSARRQEAQPGRFEARCSRTLASMRRQLR